MLPAKMLHHLEANHPKLKDKQSQIIKRNINEILF